MPEEPLTPPVTPPVTPPTTEPPSSTPSASPTTPPVEPKPPEAPKPEAPVPLTMESVKIPEGFEVDQALSEKFLGVMNDDKLDGVGRAQALIDLQADIMKAASEKAVAAWEKRLNDWREESTNDPEVGGAKLDANLSKISNLLNTYGSPEVRLVFDETGFGNNVHAIRLMAKIADALGESAPTVGTPASTEKTQAQKLFPTMK